MKIREILESAENGWPAHPLFHGTYSAEAASSIMANGLRPQGGQSRWKGDLKSVTGVSYLAGSLFHVIENYAMGEDGKGYVLVFDKNAVQKSLPDEDAVGAFIRGFVLASLVGEDDVEFKVKEFAGADVRAVCEKLIRILREMKAGQRYAMFYGTKSQRRKLPIVFGKQALKILDRVSLDVIQREDWHDRHAVSDTLKPVSCWLVTSDALQSMNLTIRDKQKDWASFQAHARRIA